MKNTFLLLLLINSLNLLSQTIGLTLQSETTMNNKTFFFYPNFTHYPAFGPNALQESFDLTIGTTYWARNLRFETKFHTNCDYNLGSSNQLDWNKLITIGFEIPKSDYTSVRLGWRWNVLKNKMELGLYGHIKHLGNNSSNAVGREFIYLTEVDLGVWFKTELILNNYGMGIIVNDKGTYIKRDDIYDITDTYELGFRKSAYFGGQATPPKFMTISTKKFKGDKFTNWHEGACEKTFSRSIFYSYETLTIKAARTITFSEQVFRGQYDASSSNPFNNNIPSGFVSGDEIPADKFVVVRNGSILNLKAGEKITLKEGTHIKPGAEFNAKIDNSIICASFQARTSNPNNNTITKSYAVNKNNNPTNSQPLTISIYPNPTKGNFSIQSESKIDYLKVVDIFGKTVHQTNNLKTTQLINLSNQPKGVYFIHITSGEERVIKKIVKQ